MRKSCKFQIPWSFSLTFFGSHFHLLHFSSLSYLIVEIKVIWTSIFMKVSEKQRVARFVLVLTRFPLNWHSFRIFCQASWCDSRSQCTILQCCSLCWAWCSYKFKVNYAWSGTFINIDCWVSFASKFETSAHISLLPLVLFALLYFLLQQFFCGHELVINPLCLCL